MLWITNNPDTTIGIPDIVVAAIWSIVAVLAIVNAVAAKNRRSAIALVLLFVGAALNIALKALKPTIAPNLAKILAVAVGALIVLSAILMLMSQNRLGRAMWLVLTFGLLILQSIMLILLPMQYFFAEAEFTEVINILVKVVQYALPVWTSASLLILFVQFILKRPQPIQVEKNPASADNGSTSQQIAEEESTDDAKPATESTCVESVHKPDEEPSEKSVLPVPKKRTLYCKHCGFKAESIYSNCPRCGNEMTEIAVCPHCRTETYGMFCGNCGTRIKK